ncbi:hypothetical protein AKAW_01679 [Aspergillus luchuensis IFO 4308]|nr:hypothetical protein AKAW_01679 [Aspergillus luchuensis IFO 4308]
MSTLTPNKIASRGPADELLDPERRKIIAQLSVYIGHQNLPSTGWALLWFADLAILKEHLKNCGELRMGPQNQHGRVGVEAQLLLKRALSISEDQKVLKVKFYWMPINKLSDAMSSREVPSPFPDGCLSSIKVEGKLNAKLFNINTEKALRSGDVLTFKTDDPVGHPLPSMELLNMQWALHRVLALSGAADATDEELDPPDPDWLQVEATDEDNEEEVESETEEDDPEEESWDEMVVESHRLNFPSCENRPASTLPRSRHDDHKDQEEQAEPADAESSPALGFRDTNIH